MIWRQLLEACRTDNTPRFRDRDAIYGKTFRCQVTALNIQDVPTAPRSPWQNAYAERVIGSIRRDCLNHLIVLGERPIQPPDQRKVIELKRVGELHHEYVRRAA